MKHIKIKILNSIVVVGLIIGAFYSPVISAEPWHVYAQQPYVSRFLKANCQNEFLAGFIWHTTAGYDFTAYYAPKGKDATDSVSFIYRAWPLGDKFITRGNAVCDRSPFENFSVRCWVGTPDFVAARPRCSM